MFDTAVPIRTLKISSIKSGQYFDGRLLDDSLCCGKDLGIDAAKRQMETFES